MLAELPAEQQPVAEQVLKGGIPAVRAAVAKQNEQARAEGKPEVKADQLVDLAEKLLPRLRAAEWRDRAEAAMADLEELDLRDLRSVIVAAEGAARDDESRALAVVAARGPGPPGRPGAERVAARRSRRPSARAGSCGPCGSARGRRRPATRCRPTSPAGSIEATDTALAADTASDRWATVLDALSFSPVHLRVEPASVPAEPDETLLTAVRATAARVPQIAARFGIDPATTPPPPRAHPAAAPPAASRRRAEAPARTSPSARPSRGRNRRPARRRATPVRRPRLLMRARPSRRPLPPAARPCSRQRAAARGCHRHHGRGRAAACTAQPEPEASA